MRFFDKYLVQTCLMFPCYVVRPQVSDYAEDLKVWRVVLNMVSN